MKRATSKDCMCGIFITYHCVWVVRYKYKNVLWCLKNCIYILSFMAFYRSTYFTPRFIDWRSIQEQNEIKTRNDPSMGCEGKLEPVFYSFFLYLLLYFILSSPPPVATRQTADSSAVFINTLQTISSFGDPPVNVVPPPGICSETRFEQEVSLGAKLLIKKNGCNNVCFLERKSDNDIVLFLTCLMK